MVSERTGQRGVPAMCPGLEGRKRGAHRLAQAAADADLVAARAAYLLTAHRRTRRIFRE
jgi:hypothetical protein